MSCESCERYQLWVSRKLTQEKELLDTVASQAEEIGKLRCILARSVEWWLREGAEKFYGSPEWLFAARQLEDK